MLRSEDMDYYNIYISKDSARNTVAELGRTEFVHFVNLNENKSPASNSLFKREIRYLEKLKLKLDMVIKEIETRSVSLGEVTVTMLDINDVEVQLEKTYQRLQSLKEIEAETNEYLERLKEDLFMLKECEIFFGGEAEESKDCIVHLGYLVGIICKEKAQLFDSVIRNSLKRNFVIHKSDVFLSSGNKTCYIVLTHGSESLAKAMKIFSSLGGRMHNMEDDKYRERTKSVLTVTSLISQISRIAQSNRETLRAFLETTSMKVRNWRFVISKETEIFRTLNYFQSSYQPEIFQVGKNTGDALKSGDTTTAHHETNIIGEAWVPRRFKTRFEECARLINENHGSMSYEITSGVGIPPTLIITNEYTRVYQELNNMFDIPLYKEINPGIFVLFAFPALFGLMFSDAFHGLLIVLLSLFLVFRGERVKPAFLKKALAYRYLLLSLGISAVYFGLLFNDFGSVHIPLFKSRILGQASFYPFGIDWGWRECKNKSEFYNSLKMKMSVIVGSLHMGFGMVLSYFNTLADTNYVKFYTEVIPQSVLFSAFNGYLVFLIFYKWIAKDIRASLIEVLIDMYTDPFKDMALYRGQAYVQRLLLSMMVTSAIWLLFSKPAYVFFFRRKAESVDWTGFIIGHFIHVMEFGVGLISNTASYLRLWAVSLAHSTLTEILHEETFGKSLARGIIASPVYLLLLLAILCGMEGVSAALHALRLNWIEFNSKFISGKGVTFSPLVFMESYEDNN